jgi:DNA-binding CsgD family transcriptional regulator
VCIFIRRLGGKCEAPECHQPQVPPTVGEGRGRLLQAPPTRECEVLRWIIHGKTDPEIAGILEIRTPTASTHVHHILTKLEVINRIIAVVEVVCIIICRRPPAPPRCG